MNTGVISTTMAVLKKELSDLIRDPRTLAVSVLLPLILFPLIFSIAGENMTGATSQIQADPRNAGRTVLALMLPFVIIIFSSACPLPFAADLSAGEKERRSLEPLLSTGAHRTAIVTGKLGAASTAGFMSLLAFCAGMTGAYLLNPGILGGDKLIFKLSAGQTFLIFMSALCAILIFAGAELVLGFLAKSVREAQLLGMPVLIVSGLIVYTAQHADSTSRFIALVPLVNLAILIRDAALANVDPAAVCITLAASLIWILLIIAGGTLLLRREAILLEQ